NASAVLLALAVLAAGKEVVISRGQLVEIGGGFRIPDVLRQSGATLVEVGTTNRTYLADYADAIGENARLLLRVQSSNFRIAGIIVGRSTAVAQLRRHPLVRALRPDKATIAGLVATLVPYVRGEAEREIPVWRLIGASIDEIEGRARRLAAAVGDTVQIVGTR